MTFACRVGLKDHSLISYFDKFHLLFLLNTEKLVEIANTRSTLLSAFDQVKEEIEGTKERPPRKCFYEAFHCSLPLALKTVIFHVLTLNVLILTYELERGGFCLLTS